MRPENYIPLLLSDHDCVIIPGFGGFIGNYAPAWIHPAHHVFHPPSKSILFNISLKQNDGLLTTSVSQGEGISYEKAIRSVEALSGRWNHALIRGLVIEVEGVGKISMGKEGDIRFVQDNNHNFLPDSYGLGSFASLPVKRIGAERTLERKINRYVSSPSGRRKSLPKAIKWAALLTIPLGIASVFGTIHFDKIRSLSTEYSGILFSGTVEQLPVRKQVPPKTALHLVTKPRPVSATVYQPSLKTIPATNTNASRPVYKPFSLIVGAFRFKENAENLVDDLKNKGFNASIIGQTKTGLYRVSLNSYSDRAEAEKQLEIARSGEFKATWLLIQ